MGLRLCRLTKNEITPSLPILYFERLLRIEFSRPVDSRLLVGRSVERRRRGFDDAGEDILDKVFNVMSIVFGQVREALEGALQLQLGDLISRVQHRLDSGILCDDCVMACPPALGAICMDSSKPELISERCAGCGLCVSYCAAEPEATSIKPLPSQS